MPKFGSIKGGLTGLTANDRSTSDKIAISQQAGEPDYMVSSPSMPGLSSSRQYFQGVHDTNAIMQNTYQDMLQQYKEQYAVDNPGLIVSTSKIQDVAYKVSPYYKKFIGSDYLSLDSNDWAKLAAQYEATKEVYGEEAANATLNSAIKDNVAENQPWYEQAWYGFLGLGASAAGAIISTAGAVKGAIDYFDGDYEDKDYMSGWENFMNSVMDNNWARYGNDVVQYGALRTDKLEKAKELGISELQIVESAEQEESLLSSATPWVALQSGGFTVASMFTGWGEAKIAAGLFKGLGTAAKAVQTGEKLTKTLTGLQKAQNFTNKFIIPGMVGTTEGLVEGLNTKQEVEQEGLKMVTEMHKQQVANEVNKRLAGMNKIESDDGVIYLDKKGKPVDVDALYQQVWTEFEPKYKESLDQVDYAATRAGINNFYVNSAINGLMNSTLKAGLQSAPVRRTLQNSRLFGWAQPMMRDFNITGSGATTTVTPRFGKAAMAWTIAKEPLGEFTEEYLQSVSDATMRGGAENNIHNFIENKYLGDGSAAVGDSFSSDYSAAWTAFTGSLVDKEIVKSGIMGAISSAMGTPAFGHKARTGRLNADGTAETTYFGRGLNERGERESRLEYLARIAPWRSGLTGSLRDARIQRNQAEEAAEALQEWLRDPDNKDKFDGLVGTFNWARQMGDAARGNDEFGYRNSTLGKTISDIFMLQKLEGTAYYDTYINQLSEIANLEEGSDAANAYIQSMRDNVNTDGNVMSDEDILKTLKKNANLMLTTIDRIQQESDHIDRLLGNVDTDTKQTLIYGQMMLEDWRKRQQQLRDELSNITINNSRSHSESLTDRQKSLLAQYNSIAEAKQELARLEKSSANLEEDIKNLKSRKNLTDAEKVTLKEKKAKLKSAKKQIKKLEEIRNFEEGADSNTVLNEEEIMALDPISRATMLLRGKEKTYLATHSNEEFASKKAELTKKIEELQRQREKYLDKNGRVRRHHNKQARTLQSQIDNAQKELDALQADEKSYYSDEQQAVIDNIIAEGTAQDRDFFSKVVDAGRIANSMKTFYDQYNAILSDKDSFNNFVFRAKQSAADIATKRRYQALNNMQEYSSFARELDRVFNEGTTREQAILTREFRRNNNANFDRYVSERNMIQGLVDHVVESDEFADLSDNDADMFVHTLTYLSNKGVDLNNESDVVAALSEVDENGVSELRKYVDEANASVEEVNRTAFTSVGEAIQNFKNIMDSYNRQQAELASNSQPITPESTTPEQSAPVQPADPMSSDDNTDDGGDATTVTPTPTTPSGGGSIFDRAATTADGSYLRPDGTPIGDVEIEGQTQSQGNPVIEAFKDNSNEEVANAAEVVLRTIENAPRFSSDAKSEAKSFVESLSNNSFDNVEEFTDAVNASANARESQSEDGTSEVANLLRQAAAKAVANVTAEAQTQIGPTATERRSTSLLDRTRRQLSEANQRLNTAYNMFPNSNSESSFIASVNIDAIRQRFPNSSTVQYYDKYGIEDALRDGILEGNPDVFFITDEELTQSISQDMGGRYSAEIALPIVAVVESKNGPITIDGRNYQPISIMASTNKSGSAGSAHMGPIRQLALANQGTQLVKMGDGNPVVTKPYGPPRAYPVDRNYRGRNSVIEIGTNDLSQSERTQLEATDKAHRRNHPAYQRAKRNFLKRLGVKDNGGRKVLFFGQSRLNGGTNPIEIFTSPIGETTARNSDATFVEVVNGNNPADIINFNSRTSRAAKAFGNFVGSFSTDEMIFDLDENGQIVPTDTTKGVLSGLASSLEKSVSNFINVPVSQGWTYSISPTMDVVGENRVMSVNLVNANTGEVIPLVNVHAGMSETELQSAQAEFLKNLITDNGVVRMSSAEDSFAKWNVPYADVEKIGENKSAADNISDIYDDGILGAPATSFNYRVQGIAVHNPFKGDGTPVFNQVANQSNAQPSTPVDRPTVTANDQVQSGDAIVDSETGTVLEGTPVVPANPAQQNAARKVDQIVEDSKNISLSEDGSAYVDSRTGVRYARVTSIIAADEHSEGRFDPNSPWATPSTNIGTGFDEFVRDFFAGVVEGRMSELEKYYPNATQAQLEKFASQLAVMRNDFIANGLTIVPRDVTVTGSLDVVDSNGNMHVVNVAGTLDLLAYDARGNFYIFDMKTNRSGIDAHKQEKYARQLSLYKKFIEDKYGVTVASMQLIPIHVEYPTPVGARSKGRQGTADYSVSPEKPNQLMIDGRNFMDAKPTLESRIKVDYRELHVVWDKLTDAERAMFGGIEEEIAAQATETPAAPVEAAVSETDSIDATDPILGTQFSDDYLGGMFGDDTIVTEGFSEDYHRRTTPIPEHLQWGNLTTEQRETLEMMGFNETTWSEKEDKEMEHTLDCLNQE